MLVLIDNYDSFTFNLVHYLGEMGADVAVHRNDAMSADAVLALKPDAIVLSPGPCTPNEAGICLDLIEKGAPIGAHVSACASAIRPSARRSAAMSCARRSRSTASSRTMRHEGGGVFHGINGPFQRHPLSFAVVDRAHTARRSRRDRRMRRGHHHGPVAPSNCRCMACSSIRRASPPSMAIAS